MSLLLFFISNKSPSRETLLEMRGDWTGEDWREMNLFGREEINSFLETSFYKFWVDMEWEIIAGSICELEAEISKIRFIPSLFDPSRE